MLRKMLCKTNALNNRSTVSRLPLLFVFSLALNSSGWNESASGQSVNPSIATFLLGPHDTPSLSLAYCFCFFKLSIRIITKLFHERCFVPRILSYMAAVFHWREKRNGEILRTHKRDFAKTDQEIVHPPFVQKTI